MRIFKCAHAISYLHSFTFTTSLAGHTRFDFSKSLVLYFLFLNEKLFESFSNWPFLIIVNLHLFELKSL